MATDEGTTDQMGLRTFTDGEGPTVIFIHGWPDDHTLWDNQVARLKNRFRCVTVDLPGFSADDCGVEKWGYTTDVVVKRIETTVLKEGKGEPVILVAHDWGCLYSHKLEAKRPELVRKMVTIDVGGSIKPGVIGGIILITYQLWLAAAFLIGPPIGDMMARFFAWLCSAPSGARLARASTCYPYYNSCEGWRQILFSGEKVKAMYPKCPLMFVYGCAGIKKMLSFHADKWANNISKKEGSCVVPIAKASHWVMSDHSDELNRRMDEFLADM